MRWGVGSPAVGTRFCGHCGAAIPAVPGPCPSCGAVEWAIPPPQTAVPRSPEVQAILETRLGLLLLAIGAVAILLPVGAIVGAILLLTGGILLIVPSERFGRNHRRDAFAGLVLAFGGAVGTALVPVFFALTVPAPPTVASEIPAWVQSLEAGLSVTLLMTIGLAVVSDLGLLLITYALQDRTGRAFLWLAFALAVAINASLYLIVSAGLTTLLNEAAAGQGLDYALFRSILTEVTWFTYLGIIPNALFAGCYFLADTRIRRGIISATPGPRPGT